MGSETEIAVIERIESFVNQSLKRQKRTGRFGHFSFVKDQKFAVNPVVDPRFAGSRLRLGDFVGMVNGNVIDTAAVNIEMIPQIFHTHGRTFDVPSRIPFPPGRIPQHGVIFVFGIGKP